MSWLNANEHFRDLLCMLKPRGKTCEDHLREKYPECFRAHSRLSFIWELPQKAWHQLYPGNECDGDNNTPNIDHCAHILRKDDSSLFGSVWKFLILIAISIGILYAIIKVSLQRRASRQ